MSNRGVFITTYFSYKDALIQAYTLPYARIIRKLIPADQPVYLFTIEQSKNSYSITNKDRDDLQAEGITLISVGYTTFGLGLLKWLPVLLRCIKIVRSSKIGTVHAWCTTGGVVGYILSVLGGKPLVLDSFEPHAEVMTETGTWSRTSLKFKVLFYFERAMARRSIFQICCTSDMAKYALKTYGVQLSHQLVKPACINLDDYPESNRKSRELLVKEGLEDKIVCIYAGKFGGLYLTGEVFVFFAEAYRHWGERFRILLLSSEKQDNILKWCKAAGLPEHLVIHKFVPHSLVPRYMGLADFGIAPYQPVPSRKYGAPIKVSEYWASGLPVVITDNIADDSQLISENNIGTVLKQLTQEEYRQSVEKIDAILKEEGSPSTYSRIRNLAESKRHFGIAEAVYKQIYGN